MRVLVTGITGFIGCEMARSLVREGHEVFGLVRQVISRTLTPIADIKNDISIVFGDIREYDSIRKALTKVEPDAIIHLAALSAVRLSFSLPFEYQMSNYIGTVNIAEALMDLYGPEKVRLIVASTADVYEMLEEKPFNEANPLKPSNPYGASKAAMEMYMSMLMMVYDFNGVIMRNSSTYGRKYDTGFFTEYLITQILDDREVYLASADSVRDYVYVNDLVEAYLLAVESPEAKGEIFNIGGGIGYSNKDWAVHIAHLSNYDSSKILYGAYPPGYPHRPSTADQSYRVLDSSKAQLVLGWKQRYSAEDGLKNTIEYWQTKRKL